MTLFERVKKISKKCGMSIAEVERKSNLSENYLYTWKRTDHPRDSTMKAVAKALGVTSDDLLGTQHQSSEDGNIQHIAVEDIVNQSAMLTSRDYALSDEDRIAIRSLVKTYLKSKEDQNCLRKYDGNNKNGNKLKKCD